jgi:hypothetical protein
MQKRHMCLAFFATAIIFVWPCQTNAEAFAISLASSAIIADRQDFIATYLSI